MVVDVRAGEDARACRAAWRLDDHEACISSLPENSRGMYKRRTTILRVPLLTLCSGQLTATSRDERPAAVE